MLHQPIDQKRKVVQNRDFIILRGWPGYRNRPGRCGLDYIDTNAEVGHVLGSTFKQLITGEWLSSNFSVHPLAFLFVAIVMLVGYIGPLICPAFLIGILILAWKSPNVQLEEEQERNKTENE